MREKVHLMPTVIGSKVPTLRPRINPYGPEVTPRVAPTPTGPRTNVFTIFCTYWDTLSSVAYTVNFSISDLLDRPLEDRH
ncbi:hypothetical protein GQ457_08G024010 [Hibiscus cannabinus]